MEFFAQLLLFEIEDEFIAVLPLVLIENLLKRKPKFVVRLRDVLGWNMFGFWNFDGVDAVHERELSLRRKDRLFLLQLVGGELRLEVDHELPELPNLILIHIVLFFHIANHRS